MRKALFLMLIVLLNSNIYSFSQQLSEEYSIKGKTFVSVGTTLKIHSSVTGKNGLYKELAIDYGIGNFISTGVFVGHQERDYTFTSNHYTSGIKTYQYSQRFIPAGLRISFHLTSFLNNQLKLNLNPEKWEIYTTYFAGLTFNKVTEKFDRNAHSPETIIDYTSYRKDEDLNYKAGILTGVKFFPYNNFGIFLEGGLGPMGNINIGITAKY